MSGRTVRLLKLNNYLCLGVLVYEVFNKGIAPWVGDRDFKAMAKRICTYDMPKFPDNTPPVVEKMVTDKIW
jgi:hypothetical protein